MNKDNIEEAGCAVCGELKPFKFLSHIKKIKNMLHVLSIPGLPIKKEKTRSHPYMNILDQF